MSPANACPSGKPCYRSFGAAERALRHARRRNRSPHDDSFAAQAIRLTRAYSCKLCRGWHLTSEPTRSGHKPTRASRRRAQDRIVDRSVLAVPRALVDGLGPQVASWIGAFVDEHGYGPSWAEVRSAMDWTGSQTPVLLYGLRRRGWIVFTETARSLRPMPTGFGS